MYTGPLLNWRICWIEFSTWRCHRSISSPPHVHGRLLPADPATTAKEKGRCSWMWNCRIGLNLKEFRPPTANLLSQSSERKKKDTSGRMHFDRVIICARAVIRGYPILFFCIAICFAIGKEHFSFCQVMDRSKLQTKEKKNEMIGVIHQVNFDAPSPQKKNK